MPKWKGNGGRLYGEFAGNHQRHSHYIHAKIYKENYRKAIRQLPPLEIPLSPGEREELSKPEPVKKRGRQRRK